MSGWVRMRFTAVFLLPYDHRLAIWPFLLILCLFTPEIDKEASILRFYFFIDTFSCLSFDEDIWPYLVKSEENTQRQHQSVFCQGEADDSR